jgi:hypothetical protein
VLGGTFDIVKNKVNSINMETKGILDEFDENYRQVLKEDQVLKEHNGVFTTHYRLYEKRTEETRKKLKQTEVPFKDLIHKYNDKGYRIPNLSVKSNLFAPSPLLLENKEIRDYYKYTTIEDRECKFLEKINGGVLDRLSKIDVPQAVRKKSEIHRRLSLRSRPVAIQNFSDLQDEHKKLKTEISRAYETLQTEEACNTYDDGEERFDRNFVRRRTTKKGSLYKTVEVMNSISSIANSTNYTGMTGFSVSPTNRKLHSNNNLILFSKFDKIQLQPTPKQIPLSQAYINSKPKARRPSQILQYKKPPVSRNLPTAGHTKTVNKVKSDHENLSRLENNKHGYIEYIYNRTKEGDQCDTEDLLKTYYKTFYKCGDQEIREMFNSKYTIVIIN